MNARYLLPKYVTLIGVSDSDRLEIPADSIFLSNEQNKRFHLPAPLHLHKIPGRKPPRLAMELFDRLRYNVLPLDMERPTIRESIGAAESHLAEMEALDLPDTLSEKAALRQYISHYSSLLAPIRRLSVEILQIIFLDPNLHDSERIAFDFVTMYRPDAFVGVSYHWREVAHGTAKLWASFQITLHSGRCSNIHRIRRGLERSKNVPLSINFSPFAFSPESHTLEARMHTQAVEEIAAEFLLHAERWAYVMLPPKNHQFLSILCPARGRLPMLEAVGFWGRPDEEARQLKIFEEATTLTWTLIHPEYYRIQKCGTLSCLEESSTTSPS
ncbi:hypothetical protein K438DRAFT_1031940 [Mycena galopus ATCC 62051]|nr:hypothetical protein K438DRAFT_1031940 [Mycena galopus ATCC 62051]